MSKTEELRRLASRQDVLWTAGYELSDGRRVNRDNVTTIWPVKGDAASSLTFYEDEAGALWCEDEVSPAQAMGAAVPHPPAARRHMARYAVWRDGGCVAIGTAPELAARLGVKEETVRHWAVASVAERARRNGWTWAERM